MGQYRRHSVSKITRKKHKAREKKRKAKLGGLAAFTFSDSRGVSKKRLSSRTGRLG
jgi:hypothetical protein